MNRKTSQIAGITLFALGGLDLFRGFMHTVMLEFAATRIAGVTDADAIFLLRAFGISNYLTGVLFILIALEAKYLAPYVLTLIPLIYAFGILVTPPVTPSAPFNGKYFMMVYFVLSFGIGIGGIIDQRRKRGDRPI